MPLSQGRVGCFEIGMRWHVSPLAERLKERRLRGEGMSSGSGQVPRTEARRSIAAGASTSKAASSSGCGSVTRILSAATQEAHLEDGKRCTLRTVQIS